MGPRTAVIAVLAVVAAIGVPLFIARNLDLGSSAKSPQYVEMSLGATAVVAGGRAKLWFAGGDTGGDFEVSCSKQTRYVQPEHSDEPYAACGVSVKLVKVETSGRVPKATYEVFWK